MQTSRFYAIQKNKRTTILLLSLLTSLKVLTLPAQAQTYEPIIDPPVIINSGDSPIMPASSVELINNGGFETGNFTGWTVFNQAGSDGNFFVTGSTSTPISFLPTVGPANGNFYAVSDQQAPGARSLLQSFTVPANSNQVMLSFNMFVNNWSSGGTVVNPAGLDFNAFPNQHARVDILTASAGPLSTAPSDIVSNLYLNTEGAQPNPYTAYNFDLTSTLVPGQTYQVRFAQVDNQSFLNQGVDDVSILSSDEQVIPEPVSTLASLILLGLGAGSTIKRKRNQ